MTESLPINVDGFILARDVRSVGRLAGLRAAVLDGRVERVRTGVYRPTVRPDPSLSAPEQWAEAYRSVVRAVAQTLTTPIFTGHSAVALAQLPIVGRWPNEVFVLSKNEFGHRRAGVTSVARTREVPVESSGGFAVTALEFSLIQMCRRAPLAAALTAVDAAIHVSRTRAPARTTLERIHAEHERLLPYPRSLRVAAVLERATPFAETPLETVSRLVIEELGFPAPELQHELWLPELGRSAFLDFHWPDHGIGAEADGRGKYLGPGGVETTIETVLREKDREDAVRRQLRGFARWDWAEAWGRTVLFTKLRGAGLPVVRRPRVLL
ncbi:hypothetical protein BJY17_002886 [Agromyces hippuratus]|uniref:Transcriptional regulator, AbiEi antitoxin, Type IV TA system n=1 Tax=Agromyces hippuratus TaxID=286438 RepID=A0A852WW11_9MICO|nr:hypothetical protein [Agromyces hippuratus]NYG22139.1 hypothetical protein [Agromyces hippuratus]